MSKKEFIIFDTGKELSEATEMVIETLKTYDEPKIQKMNEWISVKDKLPEIDLEVLVCTFRNDIGIGAYVEYQDEDFNGTQFTFNDWYDTIREVGYDPEEIVCWQPLPMLPNENNENKLK